MTTACNLNSLKFIVACVILCPVLCFAHGVKHSIFKTGVGVESTYDDGSPMAFCDVAVFSPGDPTSEYQTGTADPRGRFAFVPDTNGVWKVTVDDGMGHMVMAEIVVGPDGSEPADSREGVGRSTGTIIGVSVIFGLFGIYALVRQSVMQPRSHTGQKRT